MLATHLCLLTETLALLQPKRSWTSSVVEPVIQTVASSKWCHLRAFEKILMEHWTMFGISSALWFVKRFNLFVPLMTWVKHYLLFLTGCYEESKWDIQPAGWTSTTKTSDNFSKTIPQPELGDLKFWITWKFLDHSWGAGTAVALPVISDVFCCQGLCEMTVFVLARLYHGW